jgi:hypothetical protein
MDKIDGCGGGVMRGSVPGRCLTLFGLLIAPSICLSQADQQSGALIVSGHTGHALVTQINGRPYVAVDALARLLNGSLAYQGSRIMLTLPAGANAASAVPAASQPANVGFSKDFLNAGIETMSEIREWRSALLTSIQNGYPVTDASMADLRAQAAKNLRLTSVAATTNADHNALQLLNKEFGHMQDLGNKVIAARKNMNYITADSVKSDPLDQKILNCAHSLAAMAASGAFQDDGSCN